MNDNIAQQIANALEKITAQLKNISDYLFKSTIDPKGPMGPKVR